jgi:hypothetical protein
VGVVLLVLLDLGLLDRVINIQQYSAIFSNIQQYSAIFSWLHSLLASLVLLRHLHCHHSIVA